MSPQATAFGTQGRSSGVWSPERRRPGEAVWLPSMSRCGWRIGLGLGLGLGLGTGGYSYLPGWRAVEYAPYTGHLRMRRGAGMRIARRSGSVVARLWSLEEGRY